MSSDSFNASGQKTASIHVIPTAQRPPFDGGGGSGDDGDMNARIAALETKWSAVIPTLATKGDVEGIRVDVHKMDASIKTWMVATVIGMMIGFGGLFLTVSNSLKSSAAPAPSAAPPTIVINNIPPPGQPASAP